MRESRTIGVSPVASRIESRMASGSSPSRRSLPASPVAAHASYSRFRSSRRRCGVSSGHESRIRAALARLRCVQPRCAGTVDGSGGGCAPVAAAATAAAATSKAATVSRTATRSTRTRDTTLYVVDLMAKTLQTRRQVQHAEERRDHRSRGRARQHDLRDLGDRALHRERRPTATSRDRLAHRVRHRRASRSRRSPNGQIWTGDFMGALCQIDVIDLAADRDAARHDGSSMALSGDLVAIGDGTVFGTAYNSHDGSRPGHAEQQRARQDRPRRPARVDEGRRDRLSEAVRHVVRRRTVSSASRTTAPATSSRSIRRPALDAVRDVHRPDVRTGRSRSPAPASTRSSRSSSNALPSPECVQRSSCSRSPSAAGGSCSIRSAGARAMAMRAVRTTRRPATTVASRPPTPARPARLAAAPVTPSRSSARRRRAPAGARCRARTPWSSSKAAS